MKTSELFKKEIGFIKSKHLQNIVINTLDASPECIQTIPASSSGRYHPTYSLGDGGLARHIRATVGFAYALIESSVLEGLLKAENRSAGYDSHIEDAVYATLILHDCCKPDDTPKHSTRFDHPLEGAKLFKNVAKEYIEQNKNEICDEDMIYLKKVIPLIFNAIMCHMGKYNTAPYAKGIVLPKPTTAFEWFCHQCDLLSSRKYLEFDFEKYDKAVK